MPAEDEDEKKTKNNGLSTGATAGIVIAVLSIITIGLYSYYFKGGSASPTPPIRRRRLGDVAIPASQLAAQKAVIDSLMRKQGDYSNSGSSPSQTMARRKGNAWWLTPIKSQYDPAPMPAPMPAPITPKPNPKGTYQPQSWQEALLDGPPRGAYKFPPSRVLGPEKSPEQRKKENKKTLGARSWSDMMGH